MPYGFIIEPSKGWLRIDWRSIFHYRDLLWLLVRRDFVSQFKQSVLGPLWFIIQPLLTTVVFTVVFGKVAKIPTDGQPPILFYLCNMMAWGYFSGCLGYTSNIFLGYANIFGKVYFPRLIVPLSVVFSRLIAFGIQLGTFLSFWIYFKFFTASGVDIHLSPWIVILPLLLLQIAALGLGTGLCIAALTTRYRDLAFLAGFLTQLWMYATPVVYPLSEIPERWRFWVALNPMTEVVESFRLIFLGEGMVAPAYVITSAGLTMAILLLGLMLFSRAERTFIDTI